MSGFSDRLLVRVPEEIPELNQSIPLCRAAAELIHCALGEGKPGWVYKSTYLAELLNGHEDVINNQGFKHSHRTKHAGNLLLCQVSF